MLPIYDTLRDLPGGGLELGLTSTTDKITSHYSNRSHQPAPLCPLFRYSPRPRACSSRPSELPSRFPSKKKKKTGSTSFDVLPAPKNFSCCVLSLSASA